jgi:hypothetical protein
MKKISIYLLLMLVAGLTFTACGDDEAGYTPEVIDNPVSGVAITNATADGIVLPDAGATTTVSVALTPANGGDVERYYFDYTSSDPNIFTVDKNGLITAIGAGSATLNIIAQNNVFVKTSCKVTVVGTRITAIDLPVARTIAHPNYLDLRAAATITPSDASVQTLSYASSNPLVATVDEIGIVWAVWEGATTITATATDGSGMSATCEITVTITPVSTITFRACTLNLISNVIANNATSGTLHVNTRRNLLTTGNTTTEYNPDITLLKSGTNSGSNRIIYAPTAASRNTLSYTSSASTVVDVESDANNYLVIKPQNAPGIATVLIEATDGHGASATLTVVNHAVYNRTGWTIVDASPSGMNAQDEGGPAENVISDEDASAGFVKSNTYTTDPLGADVTESYFVVDLGVPTKFDYMLTEVIWSNLAPTNTTQTAQRPRQVSLFGSNTLASPITSTTWTSIQASIAVNHGSYYIVPIALAQSSTYRYVKVVIWSSSATSNTYKSYPYWLLKNFWLGSAE